MSIRDRGLGAVLVGVAVGWGAGNVGPVATQLGAEFEVSLARVGLLSGTVYFAAVMLATPLAVPLTARLGVVRSCALATVAMAIGHLVFALSPDFALLLVARALVGTGGALALIAGPVMARELGGVRLLGLFGGAITLGLAAALGLGSLLLDLGAGWRVGFAVSVAVCLTPLLMLPARIATAPAPRVDRTFLGAALRAGAVWRLLLLFVAANGVPLIVGAWLVAYLTRDAELPTAVAGALGFVVFGLTTLVRPLGARLAEGRERFGLLAGGGSLFAAAGLLALAGSRSLPLALVAVALMGVGFALPYAVMVDAAQRLYPGRGTATLAVLQTGPNVVPMVVIPVVGSALTHRHAPLALVLLGVVVALAGAVNLTAPTVRASTPGGSGDPHSVDAS